jgi:phosphoglycolate phosphatase-like HAD superfamily hydrolase
MSSGERALIFDVDGTLVDSNDAHAAAWAEALREFDIDRDVDAIVPLIGMGSDKMLPRMAGVSIDSDLGKRISARRAELFRDVYLDHIQPFPSTRELFLRLRVDDVRLAIASSAQEDELDALLEIARVRDLVEPRLTTSKSRVASSKPDPDSVQAALDQLDTEPGLTLMVGDSPYDIEAATRAGLGTIALRCGGWADRDLWESIAIYQDPKALLAGYEAREWTWPAAPSRGDTKTGAAPPANSSMR